MKIPFLGRKRVDAAPVAASPRVIALIVASALFMEQLDGTVLATALPTMARTFHVDPLHMSVALTAYLLSLAVLIPASGPIADRFGSRTVFRLAIILFTLGSIFCGIAPNLPVLVCARILQGVGGAMMVPVGRLVILRAAPKAQLISAMSWLMIPATIGPILGPPFGGLLVTYLDWRWIFYINVPIGLIGIAAASRYIDNIREAEPARFDFAGIVMSGVSLCCLMISFEMAGRGVGSGAVAAAVFGLGIASGMIYFRHAKGHPNPVLDFRLMRAPTFRLSVLSGTLARVSVGAMPFLLPMMLQLGFDVSAAQSGFITFSSAAGSLLMRISASWFLRRFGYRNVLVWMGLCAVSLLACCALFKPGWPFAVIDAILLVQGFFQSIQFISYNTVAYADIPKARMSAATSFYATFQQMSLALGVAFAATVLSASVRLHGREGPVLDDFSVAFLLVAAVSVFAPILAAGLDRSAGCQISGHRPKPPRSNARQQLAEPAE